MRKTVEEMIEIMQAYKEGKKIEFRSYSTASSTKWKETCPLWDWDTFDYRIKPEPHYVPYDSVDEIDRGKLVRLKTEEISRQIVMYDQRENRVIPFFRSGYYTWRTLKEMFDDWEYEDGTPFGKEVDE